MNLSRKNFLFSAAATTIAPLLLRYSDQKERPAPEAKPYILSGYAPDRESLWCVCPNCDGRKFVGSNRAPCDYCRAEGFLFNTPSENNEEFEMVGGAEVFRATMWHQWARSDTYERNRAYHISRGVKPTLPQILCEAGAKYPDIYTIPARESIFIALAKGYGIAHASEMIETWNDYRDLGKLIT